MRKLLLAATAAAVLAVGTAGCGDNGAPATSGGAPTASSSTTATPTASPVAAASTLPRCSTVWRAGHRLPHAYDGCRSGGKVVAAQHRQCSSGQVLETYGRHYYAVHGGPVQRVSALSTSAMYKSATRSCDA